ncbi:hypothetical protein J6590_073379 [Homalodisca vitripennis]|nr:hypothetical protein J6590_073379 [Homalodisca vitripennis]
MPYSTWTICVFRFLIPPYLPERITNCESCPTLRGPSVCSGSLSHPTPKDCIMPYSTGPVQVPYPTLLTPERITNCESCPTLRGPSCFRFLPYLPPKITNCESCPTLRGPSVCSGNSLRKFWHAYLNVSSPLTPRTFKISAETSALKMHLVVVDYNTPGGRIEDSSESYTTQTSQCD